MPKKTKAAPAPAGMTVETVPLDSLHLDPANARLHGDKNMDAIRASLTEFGQVEPLVCARDGKIIGGNGRYAAMKTLGWTHAVVHYVEGDKMQQAALGIVLNRTAELAEWDKDVLATLSDTLRNESTIDMGDYALSLDELKAMGCEIPDFGPDTDPPPRLDEKNETVCPECGHHF